MAATDEKAVQRDVWEIRELALSRGLRFWDVNFEVVNRQGMTNLGAYVLPFRYSHWTFGKEYGRLQKFHDLRLLEILEMVINSEPATAYLLDTNSRLENRMVIGHVFAHVDFFANNYWFSRTNRKMPEEEQYWERRIGDLEREHGRAEIERILDTSISIQWYVDFYGQFRESPRPGALRTTGEFSGIGGPPEGRTPSDHPEERDLLKFLIEAAPLSPHEQEVLGMIQAESIYFFPNALTKIMNEGWATYWHTELMREYLPFEEFDAFAVKHSQLMLSQGLNPYKLGYMLYEDIRRRWDEEHGKGEGLAKIFEVRRFEDDVSFIRNFLTQEICDKAGLFLYQEDPRSGEKVVTSTRVEDVTRSITADLTNLGKPSIVVADGDYKGKGELLLRHKFDGRELDLDYAADVLRSLLGFWKKPVHVETVVDGEPVLLSHGGEKPILTKLRPSSDAPKE